MTSQIHQENSTAIALPMPNVDSIIQLAQQRGVSLSSDGENLKVAGPPGAVAILKPHIIAAKADLVAFLAGGKGQSRQAQPQDRSAPTPLSILSTITGANQQSTQFRPTAADIDLALWLTHAQRNLQADLNLQIDHGSIISVDGIPQPVAQTVQALAIGPRANETPSSWLGRVRVFKDALESDGLLSSSPPSSPVASISKWRATSGYSARDWPAELRRPPRAIVPPVAKGKAD